MKYTYNVMGCKSTVDELLKKFCVKIEDEFKPLADERDINIIVENEMFDELSYWCEENALKCELI